MVALTMFLPRFLLRAALIGCVTALPAMADPVRIMAFGDSITEGYGLKPEEGLVPRLQAWLDAHGHDALILNAGMSGDTTYGGRVRISLSLSRHAPVDAVIVELGGNDMLMGWDAAQTERNLDAILSQATASDRPVLLTGISDPRVHSKRQTQWQEIWPRLAERHDTLLLPNIYSPLITSSGAVRAGLLQQDGVHASTQGVDAIIEALAPKVVELIEKVRASQP